MFSLWSAGVGRTGTYICVDKMLKGLKMSNGRTNRIDIPTELNKIREDRSYMVQTDEQYAYVHECILESLKESMQN